MFVISIPVTFDLEGLPSVVILLLQSQQSGWMGRICWLRIRDTWSVFALYFFWSSNIDWPTGLVGFISFCGTSSSLSWLQTRPEHRWGIKWQYASPFISAYPFFNDDLAGDKPLEQQKDVYGYLCVCNFFAVSVHLLTKKISQTMMNKTQLHLLWKHQAWRRCLTLPYWILESRWMFHLIKGHF